jgi:hypothetical protein
MASKLYQGQSEDIEIVIQDAAGVKYAHASILDVWVVVSAVDLKGKERVLMQFSKNARDGYKTLVQSATDGTYNALIERSESKVFPSEGEVYVEAAAKIDSDVFSEEYIKVERQYLYDLAKGETKKS